MARNVRLQLDAEKLLDQLVGKVRGYYRNGIYYEHDDNLASINGADLLEYIFQELPIADLERVTYRGGKNIAVVDFDVKQVWGFMSGSGSRAMDYTEEDAVDDIMSNSIGILASAAKEYRVRVDPHDYAVQNEDPDFEESIAFDVMREALWEDPDLGEGIASGIATAGIRSIRRQQLRKQVRQVPKNLATIKRELQGLPWDKAAAKVRYYVNKLYPNASKDKKAAMVKQAVGTNPKAKKK